MWTEFDQRNGLNSSGATTSPEVYRSLDVSDSPGIPTSLEFNIYSNVEVYTASDAPNSSSVFILLSFCPQIILIFSLKSPDVLTSSDKIVL